MTSSRLGWTPQSSFSCFVALDATAVSFLDQSRSGQKIYKPSLHKNIVRLIQRIAKRWRSYRLAVVVQNVGPMISKAIEERTVFYFAEYREEGKRDAWHYMFSQHEFFRGMKCDWRSRAANRSLFSWSPLVHFQFRSPTKSCPRLISLGICFARGDRIGDYSIIKTVCTRLQKKNW